MQQRRSPWGSPVRKLRPPPPAAAAASPPLWAAAAAASSSDSVEPGLATGAAPGWPPGWEPRAGLHALDAEDSDSDSDSLGGGGDLSAFLQRLKSRYALDGRPAAGPSMQPPPRPASAAAEPQASSGRVELPPAERQAEAAAAEEPPAPAAHPEQPAVQQDAQPAPPLAEEQQQQAPPQEQAPPPLQQATLPQPAEQPAAVSLGAQHPHGPEQGAGSPGAAAAGEEDSWAALLESPPLPAPPPLPPPPPLEPSEPSELGAELDAELAALEQMQRQLAGATEQEQQEETQQARPSLPPLPQQPPLPWGALHAALVERGFPGLLQPAAAGDEAELQQQQPAPAALFRALTSLLQDQARAAAHQQRLAEAAEAAGRREGALVASFTAAARQKDAEVARWKRAALDSQSAAHAAHGSCEQASRASEQVAAEARDAQRAAARLQAALRAQSEEAERARAALAAQLEREERRRRADAEALARLKQAAAAAKAAETPGGAAAALRAASQGLKPLDLLRIFEGERAALQEQAAVAAAEARAAEAQLARARESLHAAGLPCDQHDEIEGQARAAGRAAAAAEERAAAAEEEAEALRRELAERPTRAQLASVQRQADIMERQLAKAAADKAAAAEAQEAKAARRRLSTREMLRRDKAMQRLGLHASVPELPQPVLVEVVQDACALLECRQPLELAAAIRPVQATADLVPRMERWVGDVCGAVFQRGLAHVPEGLRQDNPADVPTILAAWIDELGELGESRSALRAVCRQLGGRASAAPGAPPPVPAEVVPLVAQLVELERQAFHSREVIAAAEAALASQPEVLINRICLHFTRLFGCKSLEGALPAMNRLYLAHTEAQTFLASLRAALGLEPGASLEQCANRLEHALADRRQAMTAGMLPAREAPAAAPRLPATAAARVVEVEVVPRERREALQQAAQVAVERMAAKRHWPQVEIFVPAGTGRQEGAC